MEDGDKILELVEKIPKMLTDFGSLGTAGWIAGGVLALLLGIGAIFLYKWQQDRKKEQARRETSQNRADNATSIPEEQSRLERGLRKSQERIREWVRSLRE